jgi:hypothetical protein
MIHEQPQHSGPDADDEFDADDRSIRELIAQFPSEGPPGEIETQVLSRVDRRRRRLRAVRLGGGVTAVLAAALLLLHDTPQDALQAPVVRGVSTDSRVAGEESSLSIVNAQLVSLSASAPVARFPLLNQDQLAILHCLKSLEEDEL